MLALVGALVATVVATACMVLSAPSPVAQNVVPREPQPLPIPTEGYRGRTVADAVAALEAAGAEVEVFDARAWARQVTPQWQVCTVSELDVPDTPSGIVQIAAVPVGDPCP